MTHPDPVFQDWDSLTAAQLRERGSLKWSKYGPGTIGAFVAEMDFGTAPEVSRALHAAVDRAGFGYLPPALAAELAAACAAWQAERYGWRVDPERVLPVADVLTALEIQLLLLPRPDSPVILPTPAYMPFLTVPPMLGRPVRQVPMATDGGRYVLDLDGIDAAFRDGGELLILCNPANPVGRVLTADELAAVTAVVDRHGGRVFADEVHAPLAYPGHRHLPYAGSSATAAAHTLTATSASKAWNLPGLRCAQAIPAPGELATWRRVLTARASVAASTPGAVANLTAYRSGGEWLARVLAYLDRNRRMLAELLAAALPAVSYRPPEGTYLAWLDCRGLAADRAAGPPPWARFFLDRAGVAVVEGAECGAAGAGHVRVNFATPLPLLRQAIDRMARAYADS